MSLSQPIIARRLIAGLAVLVVLTFSAPPAEAASTPYVKRCGLNLCLGGKLWKMYGATEYESTWNLPQTGIDVPDATIQVAQQQRLNSLRISNYLNTWTGDATTEPYNETQWRKVDAMIAKLSAAHMHALLDFSDFRDVVLLNCIDPYAYDWTRFLSFVANRRNTVNGQLYRSDPTIAMVAFAGEPQRDDTFQTSKGSCTLTAWHSELVGFYQRVEGQWKSDGGRALTTPGGVGHLDDGWMPYSTFTGMESNPNNDVCSIETYGGMLPWVAAGNGVSYCKSINRPWVDSEFGNIQDMNGDGVIDATDDSARAAYYQQTYDTIFKNRYEVGAGAIYWNLGQQIAPTGYDVGTQPQTAQTETAVQRNAP